MRRYEADAKTLADSEDACDYRTVQKRSTDAERLCKGPQLVSRCGGPRPPREIFCRYGTPSAVAAEPLNRHWTVKWLQSTRADTEGLQQIQKTCATYDSARAGLSWVYSSITASWWTASRHARKPPVRKFAAEAHHPRPPVRWRAIAWAHEASRLVE